MDHIGIDLGARHSHVVVMTAGAEITLRTRVETPKLPAWLERRELSRVVMEACTQSPAIARASVAVGHQTFVVPGTLVQALGVGARGIKTDDRDAEVLARASVRNEQLPSVHLRSEVSIHRRELVSSRAALVRMRRTVALSVKSWLRGKLITIRGKANSVWFCETVRRVMLQTPEGLPVAIDLLLVSFEHLCTQIAKLDEMIAELVSDDPTCTRLMQIPGVGPQISLCFTTHIDNPLRFADSDQLASYLALVPGEATTGGKVVRTASLKAGPLYLKALLVQGAWSLWRARPDEPMVVWARAIADKRGKRIAIVALARKLATVMWSMWKHGSSYDPLRTSRQEATTMR
ncbi:MAG: IS110 family transposase [Gemmatimonadaceae bacterium]